MTRNDNGDTPLHAAAFEGHLDQVPLSLLSRETLGARNYDGVSVGRTAISRGYAAQLPPALRPRDPGPVGKLLLRLGLAHQRF